MEWLTKIFGSLLGSLGGSTYFKIGLKLVEWLLDRSKMKKEDVKLFMQFLRKTQAEPRGTVRLMDIARSQEDDILEQERQWRESQGEREEP